MQSFHRVRLVGAGRVIRIVVAATIVRRSATEILLPTGTYSSCDPSKIFTCASNSSFTSSGAFTAGSGIASSERKVVGVVPLGIGFSDALGRL